MKYFIFLFSLITFHFLVACNNKKVQVGVLAESDVASAFIIDKEDTIVVKSLKDSIEISRGRHSISFNNKLENFYVKENGGIINLTQKALVVMQIQYEPEHLDDIDKILNTQLIFPNFIIVDSNLIFRKSFKKMLEDSIALKETVKQVMAAKNGNFAPLSEKEILYEGRDYDTNQKVWGFKRISADQLFVPKFWDFDMWQEIPESIIVRRHKNEEQMFGKSSEMKNILLLEKDFLNYARSIPKSFEIINVSELMKSTK